MGPPPVCHSVLHMAQPSLWGHWALGEPHDTQASGGFRVSRLLARASQDCQAAQGCGDPTGPSSGCLGSGLRPEAWGVSFPREGAGGISPTHSAPPGPIRCDEHLFRVPSAPASHQILKIGGSERHRDQACFTDQEQTQRTAEASMSAPVCGGRRVRGHG